MTRSDLKLNAKAALRGHWLVCVLGFAIPAALLAAVGWFGFAVLPPFFYALAVMVVGGVTTYGRCDLFQRRMRGEEVKLDALLSGVRNMGRAVLCGIVVGAYQLCWAAIGVVPGVLFLAASTEQEPAALIAALGVVFIGAGVYLWVFKALQYSQVFYLLLEEPELSVVAAVKKSRAIMAGRKRELLFLHITFIPWYLTVTFTAGFSLVFILPYVLLTLAGYHDMLMEKDDHAPVFILQKDKQPEPTKSKNKGKKKGKRK